MLSQVDVRSIEGTFKSLDWEVTTYTDSTVAQIRDIILKEVINIDFNTQSSHITNYFLLKILKTYFNL